MNGGIYIAVFHLPGPKLIRVGSLGRLELLAGIYWYVGSAQRNLSSRIDRHARKSKPLRWHIDYLSVHADMIGAIVMKGDKDRKCIIATELAKLLTQIPGFGASDCRCSSHLFYSHNLPQILPKIYLKVTA